MLLIVLETATSVQMVVRLFVAKGKDDNFNKGDIVDFLEKEGGINGNAISEIRIFDKFTFINIEPNEADTLLAIFSKTKGNGKPLVTRAKDRDGSGGGRSSGGGFSGGRRDENSDAAPRTNYGNRGGFENGERDRKSYSGSNDRPSHSGGSRDRDRDNGGARERDRDRNLFWP